MNNSRFFKIEIIYINKNILQINVLKKLMNHTLNV